MMLQKLIVKTINWHIDKIHICLDFIYYFFESSFESITHIYNLMLECIFKLV